MQREIEFRFWCKGTSTNANFSKCGFWRYPNFLLGKYHDNLDIFESPDFVAQQYAGLKDKNGRKIFEGDIIKNSYLEGFDANPIKIFAVIWCPRSHSWALEEDGQSLSHTGWRFGDLDRFGEVIGNIFENPELLKL